jgi:hypothetical protein
VPVGLRLLSAFFAFGATMCALTIFLLVFPGTPLDKLWRLNPEAQRSFQSLGLPAVLLMLIVGAACAFASAGLWRGRRWAIRLAIAILSVNLCADLVNAIVRHDYRTLIGLPIGGALIAYLISGTR